MTVRQTGITAAITALKHGAPQREVAALLANLPPRPVSQLRIYKRITRAA